MVRKPSAPGANWLGQTTTHQHCTAAKICTLFFFTIYFGMCYCVCLLYFKVFFSKVLEADCVFSRAHHTRRFATTLTLRSSPSALLLYEPASTVDQKSEKKSAILGKLKLQKLSSYMCEPLYPIIPVKRTDSIILLVNYKFKNVMLHKCSFIY